MNKRVHKRMNKRVPGPWEPLRRAVSVYFAVNILVTGAFLTLAGARIAAAGSERVWYGAPAAATGMDDLNKSVLNIRRRLCEYTNIVLDLIKKENSIDKTDE